MNLLGWQKTKFFQLYLNRVVTFYLFIFLVSLAFVDYEEVKEKSNVQTLNRFKPASYKYLVDLSQGKAAPNTVQLKQYLRYYQKVAENMPSQSGAYVMEGVCHYYLGDLDKALESFKKAVAMNPNVALYRQNLGVLYYKLGDFRQANENFLQVIRNTVNPAKNFEYLSLSKVFRPLIVQAGINSEETAREQMQADYKSAYALLIVSYFRMGEYANVLRYSLAAIELNLPGGDFHYLAGLGAYHLNQFQTAAVYFKKYIERRADNPDAYYYLGHSLKAIGLGEFADNFLRTAQQKDEDHDEVIANIENVHPQFF